LFLLGIEFCFIFIIVFYNQIKVLQPIIEWYKWSYNAWIINTPYSKCANSNK
jgi:hypothetical protein